MFVPFFFCVEKNFQRKLVSYSSTRVVGSYFFRNKGATLHNGSIFHVVNAENTWIPVGGHRRRRVHIFI